MHEITCFYLTIYPNSQLLFILYLFPSLKLVKSFIYLVGDGYISLFITAESVGCFYDAGAFNFSIHYIAKRGERNFYAVVFYSHYSTFPFPE